MLVAFSVLMVGVLGLAVSLGIGLYKESKEEDNKNDSNSR